jgi:hypothetical protein
MVPVESSLRQLADHNLVLQEDGNTVISATGVDGATALLEANQPFDVLFIDLNLGNDVEAGLRVATAAKKTRPDLRLL